MRLVLQGPNLSAAGQAKGDIHVHAAGCGDLKHYGPDKRFGGDSHDFPEGDSQWIIDATSLEQVVRSIYGDQLRESGLDWTAYADEIHFAPCVRELPAYAATREMFRALDIARVRAAEACNYDNRAAKVLERLNELVNEIREEEGN